jgi:hypothetical protein
MKGKTCLAGCFVTVAMKDPGSRKKVSRAR